MIARTSASISLAPCSIAQFWIRSDFLNFPPISDWLSYDSDSEVQLVVFRLCASLLLYIQSSVFYFACSAVYFVYKDCESCSRFGFASVVEMNEHKRRLSYSESTDFLTLIFDFPKIFSKVSACRFVMQVPTACIYITIDCFRRNASTLVALNSACNGFFGRYMYYSSCG